MKKIVLTIFLAVMACGAQAQWSLGASAGGDYNWYSINTQYQNDYHYEGAWGWSAAIAQACTRVRITIITIPMYNCL